MPSIPPTMGPNSWKASETSFAWIPNGSRAMKTPCPELGCTVRISQLIDRRLSPCCGAEGMPNPIPMELICGTMCMFGIIMVGIECIGGGIVCLKICSKSKDQKRLRVWLVDDWHPLRRGIMFERDMAEGGGIPLHRLLSRKTLTHRWSSREVEVLLFEFHGCFLERWFRHSSCLILFLVWKCDLRFQFEASLETHNQKRPFPPTHKTLKW